VSSHLVCDQAEQMQRIGMLPMPRQNLPIDRLRLGQPTGLLIGDAQLNRLLERNLRHRRMILASLPRTAASAAAIIPLPMALEVGIVGLPLVGKTTIFNALTAAGAEATAYSKASTKPNVGVAKVPEERLKTINQFIATKKIGPATIQIVDVAGIARGAATGEG